MKFAVTIGSYAMPEFVELNILALRHVFGHAIPILVSDDWSDKSVEIRDLAGFYGAHHTCSESPRGHFAGDCQATVNALAFAEAEKADIALKISQRIVLCEPVCQDVLERHFSDPNVWLALPARIPPGTIKRAESRFFSNMAVQTDLLAIRTGTISPAELKDTYETKVRGNRMRHAALIEGLWADMIDTKFAGHYAFMLEFTAPFPGRDPLYLRKCQSQPADYLILAEKLGMKWVGHPPLLQEWRQLSNAYRPVPQFM